jgi:ABC-2 type transport system ATP-binding protein
MGLIGANGAGKTTTIRCLLGMRPIVAGEIELLGHRVPGPVALRQDVGAVFDHTYLVGDWRLAEVERALRPFYDRWDGARYRQLLDGWSLELRAKVKDLSRGMQMKLMISVALSHHARLLVFDEPTSGLDPVARDELVGIIGDFLLDDGHSVLFSTHITSDLDRIGDYVTLIHGGRVAASGPKDEILDSYRAAADARRSHDRRRPDRRPAPAYRRALPDSGPAGLRPADADTRPRSRSCRAGARGAAGPVDRRAAVRGRRQG